MNKQYSDENDSLIREIREELDLSCERLDAQTQAQLKRIRYQAFQQASSNPVHRFLLPGAFAGACMLVLALLLFVDGENADPAVVSEDAIENIELISADEGLDFYEDIDFYQWLSMNEEL